jgi:hypothetical protein
MKNVITNLSPRGGLANQPCIFSTIGSIRSKLGCAIGSAVSKRREFIILLSGVGAARPFAARAQQPNAMRRVGIISPQSAQTTKDLREALPIGRELNVRMC